MIRFLWWLNRIHFSTVACNIITINRSTVFICMCLHTSMSFCTWIWHYMKVSSCCTTIRSPICCKHPCDLRSLLMAPCFMAVQHSWLPKQKGHGSMMQLLAGTPKRNKCMKCLVLEPSRLSLVVNLWFEHKPLGVMIWGDPRRSWKNGFRMNGSKNVGPHLEVSSSKTWRCPRSDLFCFLSNCELLIFNSSTQKNGWFFEKFMRIHWAPLATVTFKVPVGYCYGDRVIDSCWLNESSF